MSSKTGILLINLGTPTSPSVKDVRAYLKEFLGDPLVVQLPRLLWLPILYGIILPFRGKSSAKLYQSIWTDQGSPLLYLSQQLANTLQQQTGNHVELAMRYGQPNIESALDTFHHQGIKNLTVIPLFPQYSVTTTGSILKVLSRHKEQFHFDIISDYYQSCPYIQALANQVKNHWQQHGRAEKLLLSFHGLPMASMKTGDPYYFQCLTTAKLLTDALDLQKDQWQLSFQSRLGKAEWLQPYTEPTLKKLAQSGIKSVDVFCPGFAVDCLETIEEIAVEAKQAFLAHGGKCFYYIPALNSETNYLTSMIKGPSHI